MGNSVTYPAGEFVVVSPKIKTRSGSFRQKREIIVKSVVFEHDDKSIEAYCKRPFIQSNITKSYRHSPDFDPTPSPALQRMFNENYIKNQQNKQDLL
eukprot:36610_1